MAILEILLIVAAWVGAIVLVYGIVRAAYKQRRKEQDAQADALIEEYLKARYPATMTKEQCREMNASRWDGDRQ